MRGCGQEVIQVHTCYSIWCSDNLFIGVIEVRITDSLDVCHKLEHSYTTQLSNSLPAPPPCCGCPGDVESTEPTKSLMRIAEYIDSHPEREELRAWFMEDKESVLDLLATTSGHSKSNGEVGGQPRCVCAHACVCLCVLVHIHV